MTELQPHPIADLFPLMDGQQFTDLVNNIRQQGLRESIWLFEGQILDGRNRYRACQQAGVDPVFADYQGDDPVGFVVSLNLHRRHLTDDQRKVIAAELPCYEDGDFLGNQYKSGDINNHIEGSLNSKTPINSYKKYTTKESADLMNVTVNGVSDAKKLKKQAIPELLDKVRFGDVKLSVAAQLAELPEEEQQRVLMLNKKATIEAAKKIRQKQHTEKASQLEAEKQRQAIVR